MKNIDLIVMGKTGSGKSTLINAVLEEDLAQCHQLNTKVYGYLGN